jgi:hypothetical protein
MEKGACAMRVSAKSSCGNMDFTSADSCGCKGLLPSPFKAQFGREILVMLITLFQALQRFLEILSLPYRGSGPFTASVTIFEGSKDFRFLQTLRL